MPALCSPLQCATVTFPPVPFRDHFSSFSLSILKSGKKKKPLSLSSLTIILSFTLPKSRSILLIQMASSSFISLVSIFFFLLILSFYNYTTFSLRVDLSSSSFNLEREGEGRQMKRRVTAQTSEVWCVAKNNAEDTALQSGLDWVCGLGGADCGPIQQSGACYEPNNIQALASYAFNDYFHKNILDPQACVFGNTAALTALNPSHGKCVFPSSFLARNGSFTGSATGANGMGSSAGDLNGSYNACRWAQSLVAVLMMLSIALIL